MTRTYSELVKLDGFAERFRYLRLGGGVGNETFGFDRYLNQRFYKSPEWKSVRNLVIVRDNGCDLGVPGRGIYGKIFIHHMNPVTPEAVRCADVSLLDPEYLICVSHTTHNAIHYGDEALLGTPPTERQRNDTCPWKR